MIKIRKKILAVLLTAAMLVSMSSLVAWSDEQPATDDGTSQTEQTTDDGASADDKQDDKKDDKKDVKSLLYRKSLSFYILVSFSWGMISDIDNPTFFKSFF